MYNWISVEKMIESFGQAYGMEWIEQYYIKTEEQILQSAKKNSSRSFDEHTKDENHDIRILHLSQYLDKSLPFIRNFSFLSLYVESVEASINSIKDFLVATFISTIFVFPTAYPQILYISLKALYFQGVSVN